MNKTLVVVGFALLLIPQVVSSLITAIGLKYAPTVTDCTAYVLGLSALINKAYAYMTALGGLFIIGLGAGWNKDDKNHHRNGRGKRRK